MKVYELYLEGICTILQLLKDNTITKDHLVSLYSLFIKHGDNKQAQNILDLYEKMDKGELVISFAGHFSAGKSSVINDLLGQSLLPQSPIPTSANLVKLKSGEGVVRVHFHNEPTIEYSEPYDIDVIKEYCQNKDRIKKIEINSSELLLPNGTALMDTPGIDAADDADRLMTEGSLHIVDVIFYVMDYNHVQSEVNLQFLQGIQEKNIPFILIINQIDKHNEEELAFSTYKDKIKQTFNQWGILPEEIFFTSLTDRKIRINEIQQVKQYLTESVTSQKDDFFSIERSVTQIMEDHKQFIEDQYNEDIETIKAESDGDYETSKERVEEINHQIETLTTKADHFDKEFQQIINSTLQNAYIMPAELREQASLYLESQQQDFKAGLFSSKKKTEEQKEIRLNNFLQPLQENAEKFIQWKLRDKIVELMKSYNITESDLMRDVQSLKVMYTSDHLESLIKPGATVNAESVLNYTKDVSNDIKAVYKKETINLKEAMLATIKNQVADQIHSNQNELSKMKKAVNANSRITDLMEQFEIKIENLNKTLIQSSPNDHERKKLEQKLQERLVVSKEASPTSTINKHDDVKSFQTMEKDVKKVETVLSIENVLEGIDDTLDIVHDIPGFSQILADLKNKREKLANREFTITLFGAFSAGKSSFANALIGESVLPVSPNPTTAAINRISPVSNENQHGSVVITLKEESTIIQDSLALLKGFSPESDSLESFYNWLLKEDISSLSKTSQLYLKAIIDGYEIMKDHIGDQINTTINNFPVYVTDETKACFVESIDLYYDCALTKQGITLVDTPGADSVNARHTNVAFDYIKHADAILYVTYYNHALSRADKDFLMQLGRVKESFELDKMFFIINAADLAKDNHELSIVKNYVNEQLLLLGIRFPKLFPVSSRGSLAEKLEKETLNNYMFHFEEQFYHFIHHDLTKLSIQSALWDMERAYKSIKSYVSSVKMSEKEKLDRKESLQHKKAVALEVINNLDRESYLIAINQKIDKQLYYVLDRLSIRFHDMFKEMFNPTTIQDSGKNGRIQLENSMKELLDYTGYELLQELRAVSLRIEAMIRMQVKEIGSELKDRVNEIDSNFSLPSEGQIELNTPEFNQAFTELSATTFAKALSQYKGTKSFFEKNEKEQMKEAIYTILQPYAKEYIETSQKVMDNDYNLQWSNIMKQLKETYAESIESYIDGLLNVLSDQEHQLDLFSKEDKLKAIMNKMSTNPRGE